MDAHQLSTVLAAAVLAPSVHNTQPWHFSIDADGALLVHADRSRQLAHQDPDGRELTLSCGAAAAHARTAARGMGLACHVVVTPQRFDPDLLAKVVVGGPSPTTDEERRRMDAVTLRRTDRTGFSPEPVGSDVLADLRYAVQADGAWVRVLGADDSIELAVLLAAADSMLSRDAGVQEDLRRWTREDPNAADGIPVGGPVPQRVPAGSPVVVRDFAPWKADGSVSHEPPVAEHPALVVLGTAGDAPSDWVRSGIAMSDLLLAATARGLVASPLTQVLEVPATRNRLATAIGVLGRPHMVLRLGWPTGIGSPHTGRRPVSAVL